MYNIVICDDNEIFCFQLEDILNRIFKERPTPPRMTSSVMRCAWISFTKSFFMDFASSADLSLKHPSNEIHWHFLIEIKTYLLF